MSILIKGMDMPKDGEMLCINIYPSGTVCINLDRKCKRVANAVPVPPHGRLIDADALDKAFTQSRWDDGGLSHWGDRKNWCMFGDEVETLFNSSPTIIPAEEGE